MTAQILALIIFLAMFVLIILEIWDRHLITLGCGLLTLILVFGFGMHSMNASLGNAQREEHFHHSILVRSRRVLRGILRYQLADHYLHRRYDDHGGRNGKGRLFPLALHASCKAGKISGHPYFCDLYGIILCTRYVYRQHYGDPVSGSCDHRAFQASGI